MANLTSAEHKAVSAEPSASQPRQRIVLLPGDGIGPEVVAATQQVLETLALPLDFQQAEAGWACFERCGQSLPEATLQHIANADAVLAGAFTSPKRAVPGFFSAIRALRKALDLYANLRPAKSRPVPACRPDVDMLMVRENSEDLYVAQERRYGDIAIADMMISRQASARIAALACQMALQRRKRLCIVHKANVLPLTSGLFLETAYAVAADYPQVDCYDLIVDAAALKLVREPESFDVIVTTNMFGDILSDLSAGLVGGLGVAPSANLGSQQPLYESVHGSAPDIAGRGIANPSATLFSAVMMLEHLGYQAAATRLEQALNQVLASDVRTPDLGGQATSTAFRDAVIAALRS